MNEFAIGLAICAVVLCLLVILASVLLVLSARKAAKAAVVDTLRLDAIQQRRLSVFAGEGSTDWGVMAGSRLAASSPDLRAAIDTVLAEEDDRG